MADSAPAEHAVVETSAKPSVDAAELSPCSASVAVSRFGSEVATQDTQNIVFAQFVDCNSTTFAVLAEASADPVEASAVPEPSLAADPDIGRTAARPHAVAVELPSRCC